MNFGKKIISLIRDSLGGRNRTASGVNNNGKDEVLKQVSGDSSRSVSASEVYRQKMNSDRLLNKYNYLYKKLIDWNSDEGLPKLIDLVGKNKACNTINAVWDKLNEKNRLKELIKDFAHPDQNEENNIMSFGTTWNFLTDEQKYMLVKKMLPECMEFTKDSQRYELVFYELKYKKRNLLKQISEKFAELYTQCSSMGNQNDSLYELIKSQLDERPESLIPILNKIESLFCDFETMEFWPGMKIDKLKQQLTCEARSASTNEEKHRG